MKKILLITFFVTGLISIGEPLKAQASEKWYLRRTPPEPWTWAPILNTNIAEMDNVFGAGGWNSGYFSTVDPNDVFDENTCFVFIEGGDDHAIPMNDFVTDNITLIEDWVAAGGNLFMNAAPNYGGDIDAGFGGVTINYPDYTSDVDASDPTHPIFNGPYTPVGLSWSGTYFGHSSISGPGLTVLIEDAFTGKSVCSELTWGAGKVIFGGMTVTSWHSPTPQNVNLRQNIFDYLSSYVFLDFSYPDSVYCQFEPDPAPVFAADADTGTFIADLPGLAIDSITGVIDLSASLPGTYVVTNFMAGTSCASGSSSFTVTVAGTPIANAGPDMGLCIGDSIQLDGSGGVTYQWIPPVYLNDATLEDPTVMSPLTNMFYQLIAFNAFGCPDTDDVMVTLFPDPIIDAGDDVILMLGSEVELNASGGVSYVWSPAETLTDPNISNPYAFPEDTTMYVVVGTDANGCDGTDSMFVYVIEDSDIWSPTAFTPNNDGLNDVYKPGFLGIGAISDYSIYNRWGKLIFYSDDPMIGWDGTLDGREQEIGTYVVVIKGLTQFGEPVTKTSTLALLR